MIEEDCFGVEPWHLRESRLDLSILAQSESLFALSNGHIGLRGNLDEGEPHGIPGSYLGGVHEIRPLPYAEAGYGYPEAGQSVVSITNGKLIRLLVDDEPLDVRYGELHRHERLLDLRAGTLTRDLEWTSPAGKPVRVRSTRLVSFTHRAVAAICYEVEAVHDATRVVLQSELVANEEQPPPSDDPRVAAALSNPLVAVSTDQNGAGAILLHRTRESGLLVGAGMDHLGDLPDDATLEQDVRDDWARTTVTVTLDAGERLTVVKVLAYGWSAVRTEPAIRDQVAAALSSARAAGWDVLLRQQREALDVFWAGADVEVEGDPVLQQAVRFGLFHVLQSGARAERRAIAAKGLTGPGYDGHAFRDTEGFVLPVLAMTVPHAARDALRWRHSTLEKARARARTLSLKGAAFPWRTIAGEECSAYWPAGTAAFHVNADIAYAVERYLAATGDADFDREVGIELLVETARLWISLGHHDRHGTWHVDGVTGPDEYSALADDNLFTNLMAARNLRAATAACARHPQRAAELRVDNEELETWRDAAASVAIPYDDDLRAHSQSAGFMRYREFEAGDASYPLFLHVPYGLLYSSQVCKQADLLLALHWCGDAFTAEDKARDVDYYERRTVRDSSLSASTQAVMCAEVGHLELAHAYATETALMDLRDLQDNGANGLHMASLAGAWSALVEGFAGMRARSTQLCFDPALPAGITRLAFHLRWRGVLLHTDITHGRAAFTAEGGDIELNLHGADVLVPAGSTHVMDLKPRKAMLPPPPQPPGRAPVRPKR
ncbi:MAG: glycoside hydrolase family 65 protein [Mycobacteriales bacterium]